MTKAQLFDPITYEENDSLSEYPFGDGTSSYPFGSAVIAAIKAFPQGKRTRRNNAQLINQTSGDTEYYTPQFIIESARQTLGDIDLDPASSATANRIVGAKRIYTAEDDGLTQPWTGNVWMNHPFGRESNPKWIEKLVGSYKSGSVRNACCITFACTSERWFQSLFNHPMCFLSPRTNYYLADGTLKTGVTKGSVVTYLGNYQDDFFKYFWSLGRCVMPAKG